MGRVTRWVLEGASAKLTDNQIHTILQVAELKLESAIKGMPNGGFVLLALNLVRSSSEIRRAYVDAIQSAIENA